MRLKPEVEISSSKYSICSVGRYIIVRSSINLYIIYIHIYSGNDKIVRPLLLFVCALNCAIQKGRCKKKKEEKKVTSISNLVILPRDRLKRLSPRKLCLPTCHLPTGEISFDQIPKLCMFVNICCCTTSSVICITTESSNERCFSFCAMELL